MLIASGPSASATAMAALTISARDSPRSRRGGCAPRSRCRWTCPAIRSSRASSRDAWPERRYWRRYRKYGDCSSLDPRRAPRSPRSRRSPGASGPPTSPSVFTARPSCSFTAAPSAAQHARTSQASHVPAATRIKTCFLVHRTAMVHRTGTYDVRVTGSDDGRDSRHPGGRTGQELREDAGAGRAGPDGAGRHGLRTARTQRRGQDHRRPRVLHPAAPEPGPGAGAGARRGDRGGPGPAA